jgi:hypothetical protein
MSIRISRPVKPESAPKAPAELVVESQNPPNTWAKMVASSLGVGTKYPHVPGQARVVKTPEQIKQEAESKAIKERTQLVEDTVENIRNRFGKLFFEVYRDAHDWHELEYWGNVESFEELMDIGTFKEWKWWHGYNPQEDVLVEFHFKKRLHVYYRIQLGDEYKARSNLAIENAPYDDDAADEDVQDTPDF